MTTARSPVSFLATTEPASAERFYTDVMDLQLLESSPFALVFADGETILRVQIVPELSLAPYTVHGWQVTDIDGEIEKLASNGVQFLTFDQLKQSASGIWTTPDGHKIAWFKDPSGNILSLTQHAS